MTKPGSAKCSFCKQNSQKVGPLVQGPDETYICSECVSLCQSILEQEAHRRKYPSGRDFVVDANDTCKVLDNVVDNQDEAKAALVAAATSSVPGKRRALLISSSSMSVMFLAKALAHAIDVPFAKGDPINLEKRGTSNPLFDLLSASDFDVELAQHGVLFLPGMERPEAQDVLLRLWDNNFATPIDELVLDVRGVLFVCGATYVGFDEVVNGLGRHHEQPITDEVLKRMGARSGWGKAVTAIARISPLDERALMNVVEWVKFPEKEKSA